MLICVYIYIDVALFEGEETTSMVMIDMVSILTCLILD